MRKDIREVRMLTKTVIAAFLEAFMSYGIQVNATFTGNKSFRLGHSRYEVIVFDDAGVVKIKVVGDTTPFNTEVFTPESVMSNVQTILMRCNILSNRDTTCLMFQQDDWCKCIDSGLVSANAAVQASGKLLLGKIRKAQMEYHETLRSMYTKHDEFTRAVAKHTSTTYNNTRLKKFIARDTGLCL